MTAPQLPQGFQASHRAPYEPKVDQGLLEEIRGNSTMREALRNRARHDRYFLASGVLGYADVNPYTHGPLCRALEQRDQKRRMFLMHRGSLKTTIATVADCVGDALEDPNECRTLIINEIEQNAVGFLSEIKAHFETGELLRELFPELLPDRFGGPGSRWSSNQACLRRSTSYAQWTWSAVGVGSAVTGRHFTKIKCDDLIGFEARESPAAMRYAIAYAKSLEPLLIDMDEHYIDFVGTRWAINDLYRSMLEAYLDEMLYFAREDIEMVPRLPVEVLRLAGFGHAGKGRPPLSDAEVLAKVNTLQPIFPRKFSLKKLARLATIDPVLYYAQFKNNPVSDGVKDFNATKLRWFDFDSVGNIVYRDEAGRLQRWTRDQLDVVMTCDPNSGSLTAVDYPAIVVSAQSPKDQVFVLESWSRRVPPDGFVDMIYEMWSRWQPRVLGIEEAGQQSTRHYFNKKARELRVYVFQQTIKPKNRDKSSRIRKALQPIINQGRLFVRHEQTVLRRQVQFHPDLDNDDELDALAYGAELWRSPLSKHDMEEEEDAVQRVLARRSTLTGYGA
jgi:hypothetical protein